MGLYTYDNTAIPKSDRIPKLVENLYAKMPEIESARAKLITESYKQTENEPIIIRRAKAFEHILENIPIVIRDLELIVGSTTLAPRGCQTYPEFSYEWLEAEFDTVETRSADPFYISEQTKQEIKEADAYWKGKTTSELATAYMEPETLTAMEHNMFTPGNYFYNGVGHVTVKYWEVLHIGFAGIREKAEAELASISYADGNYQKKSRLLQAMIISCNAAINYARRYAQLALDEAQKCTDEKRKLELLQIAQNCVNVPEKGATSFYEACQSFWFVQQLLQIESSGHSISPGRFDQYMYPYYKNGTPHDLMIKAAELTRTGIGLPAYYNDEVIIPSLMSRGVTLEDARDYNIIGCVEPQKAGKTDGWHDAAFFNMCRPLELVFHNGKDKGVQVGPQTGNVEDMDTFEKFYHAYKVQMEYMIKLLVNADNAIDMAHAERCPLPFLSSMIDDCMKSGKSVQEGGAVYNFTGPQGFGIANMADSLYVVKTLVYDEKKLSMKELKEALTTNYGHGLNQEDIAAMTSEVAQDMAATGQQVGPTEIATILQSVVAAVESPEAKANGDRILKMIEEVPKFGNDDPEVDAFARDVAYTYTKPMLKYHNPRGGQFQAGLYPVSANVPLGAQTGATPDGRLAYQPVADGVSPSAGKDVNGPTAAANSVSRLDHGIASNGTLFNQKFHPSALSGRRGLENFVGLIRSYFDQKGSHMQFNVVSRETLLDAQKHPEQYKHLVVRVAGYSALFTTLSKSLQDDIIRRTEQGF